MEKLFPKQAIDQSDTEIEQMKNQLDECSFRNSNKSLNSCTSIKKFMTLTEHKIQQPFSPGFKTKSGNFEQNKDPSTLMQTIENETIHCFVDGSNSPRSNSQNNSPNGLGSYIVSRKKYLKGKKQVKQLKDVIRDQKANDLKTLFCNKIKRNNLYSTPIELQIDEQVNKKSFFWRKGVSLRQRTEKIMLLAYIFNMITSILVFSLSIVFPEIEEIILVEALEISGALFFFIEIVFNFITVRFSLGKKLQTLKDIGQEYIHHRFPLDCINLFVIMMHMITKQPVFGCLRLIVLSKLPDSLEKLEKLEVYFIQNYHNENYWNLAKVLLFNFSFAHVIAIVLIAMSYQNPNNNWLIIKGLQHSPWFQKYIWSYYWATTTMLTVGFGDFVPACYQEALCMVFVMTTSCMVLAYNISCVGTLISDIRSRDIEKSKNLKIFKKLVDKNEISQTLTGKVNNYIEEHTNIQKLFNIDEEAHFVQQLPVSFKTQYLKQANKKIFHNIFFFSQLLQKTLFSLAQKISIKITHPEQIILTSETAFDTFILKSGEVGYVSNIIDRKFNDHVFDKLKVHEKSSPFLLLANFVTKKRSNFSIKSIIHSALYCLKYEHLIETLQANSSDYEYFCRLRDKCHIKIDQFQVLPCQFCQESKHTKFSCPKLHYNPLAQQVINKYLYKQKSFKNKRQNKFKRIQTQYYNTLTNYLQFTIIYNGKRKDSISEPQSTYKRRSAETSPTVSNHQTSIFEHLKKLACENQSSSNGQIDIKSGSSSKTFSDLKSMFLENTSEIIRVQINNVLGFKNRQDYVWLLELDQMKNYRDYFADCNPRNLINKFNGQLRIKGENNTGNMMDAAHLSDNISIHQRIVNKQISRSGRKNENENYCSEGQRTFHTLKVFA